MIFGNSDSSCCFFFTIPQIQDQFHADFRYDNRFFCHMCTLYLFFFIKLGPSLWRSLRINLRKWLTLELLLSRYRVGTWKKKGVQRRKGKKRKKLLIRTKCWGDQPQTCTWLALQISPWPKRRWGRNNGKVSTCFEIGLSSADGNIFLSTCNTLYNLQ